MISAFAAWFAVGSSGAQRHTRPSLAHPAGTTTVTIDPATRRAIGGITALDRLKWFGGHWEPDGPSDWRPEDLAEFGPAGYRAHPGRSFAVSSLMAETEEDAARPGFVDRDQLIRHCGTYPHTMGGWPAGEVDMVHSSKTEQLYPNGCKGQGGARPKGFLPGSHAATAEFFELFYAHCMYPTSQTRYDRLAYN